MSHRSSHTLYIVSHIHFYIKKNAIQRHFFTAFFFVFVNRREKIIVNMFFVVDVVYFSDGMAVKCILPAHQPLSKNYILSINFNCSVNRLTKTKWCAKCGQETHKFDYGNKNQQICTLNFWWPRHDNEEQKKPISYSYFSQSSSKIHLFLVEWGKKTFYFI